MITIEKPAYNEEWRVCEFRRPDGRGPLNSDETVQSVVSVTCADRSSGADASAAMISGAAVYNNTQVRYQLKGGTVGTTYVRAIRIITSNGQKLEDKLFIKVI